MNARDITDLISEKGGEYARAKAQYEMLSESKKSVIAKIASSVEGSEATRERIARSSKEFKEYLYGVQQARQRELELKYEMDGLVMKFEYRRSMNSLKKKEIDLL